MYHPQPGEKLFHKLDRNKRDGTRKKKTLKKLLKMSSMFKKAKKKRGTKITSKWNVQGLKTQYLKLKFHCMGLTIDLDTEAIKKTAMETI